MLELRETSGSGVSPSFRGDPAGDGPVLKERKVTESKRVQLLDLGIEWTGEFVRRIGVLPAFVRSLACFRALAERLQSARGPPLSAVSARFRRVRSRSHSLCCAREAFLCALNRILNFANADSPFIKRGMEKFSQLKVPIEMKLLRFRCAIQRIHPTGLFESQLSEFLSSSNLETICSGLRFIYRLYCPCE